MKNILIIGATSAIATATARLWASEGHKLYLLARDEERLAALAADLKLRGAPNVHTAKFAANELAGHQKMIEQAIAALNSLDVVLIAHGTLADQKACARDFELTLQELNTNTTSVLSLLTHLATKLEEQKSGTLAVIGSVAGDRGRQSNYVYGTAKGAVAIFLQGLRQRLAKSKVHVLTIKPGFVDTPMTEAFTKGLLWASPATVAKDIAKAVAAQKDVIYTPWFWRWVMLVIKMVPEKIFKKLTM